MHDGTQSDPSILINETGSLDYARIMMASNTNKYFWMQQARSSGPDPEYIFRYNDNGTDYDIMTIDGDDRRTGINDTSPEAALEVRSVGTDDPLRVRLGGSTKLMVHNNGAVGIGSATQPNEDNLLEIHGGVRIVPETTESCSEVKDVGKLYYDTQDDKLRLCVGDVDGPIASGGISWINLH